MNGQYTSWTLENVSPYMIECSEKIRSSLSSEVKGKRFSNVVMRNHGKEICTERGNTGTFNGLVSRKVGRCSDKCGEMISGWVFINMFCDLLI